jgi:hypothetical protein
MPSRAKAAEAKEPAGPPPTTSTVQLLGIDIVGWKEGGKVGYSKSHTAGSRL